MFGDLLEDWALIREGRTKDMQLRGLSRTTGHIGNPHLPDDGYVEKHSVPRRKGPVPKKGRWDSHPGNVKAHKSLEKETSQELARSVSQSSRRDSPAARTIKALRSIRDKPSKLKQRKATAARRLPIKFPK
jgi:hypothetical protein